MEALGFNIPGIIAQVVNFSLLLGLLYMFLYKPVLGMLDQRSARIKESMERAEALKEETARTEQRVREHLEDARREGQAIIAQAAEIGERLKEEARREAKKETESILSRARSEIRIERDAATDQLRKEFADLAILAAEKVISISLDKAAHKKLIEEVLEKSAGLRKN
ncbi:MAG: F0F1 ATP synthase subunit B [Chloroflexi bacterium]|nr:F0F1 ATP synthase subunit B [Chloroflexota bacterium]